MLIFKCEERKAHSGANLSKASREEHWAASYEGVLGWNVGVGFCFTFCEEISVACKAISGVETACSFDRGIRSRRHIKFGALV